MSLCQYRRNVLTLRSVRCSHVPSRADMQAHYAPFDTPTRSNAPQPPCRASGIPADRAKPLLDKQHRASYLQRLLILGLTVRLATRPLLACAQMGRSEITAIGCTVLRRSVSKSYDSSRDNYAERSNFLNSYRLEI